MSPYIYSSHFVIEMLRWLFMWSFLSLQIKLSSSISRHGLYANLHKNTNTMYGTFRANIHLTWKTIIRNLLLIVLLAKISHFLICAAIRWHYFLFPSWRTCTSLICLWMIDRSGESSRIARYSFFIGGYCRSFQKNFG